MYFVLPLSLFKEKMDPKYLHLIKGKNEYLAYYYPAFALIPINKMTFNVIQLLKEKVSVDIIAEKYNLSINDIHTMCSSIRCLYPDIGIINKSVDIKNTLERITLHVSNDCNLRCKYCYAAGGSYKQKREMMSLQTAAKFVDFCSINFGKISQIVFFGGEPMLNIEVMKFICNRFKKEYDEGKSLFMPKFGIITNGTILNREVIAFIKDNISFITVSLDGPKKINDANRIFADGTGSYDKISEFIRAIKAEVNIPIVYEATFTQAHLNAKCGHDDINKALSEEFDINGVIIDEITLSNEHISEYWKKLDYEDLVASEFTNLPKGFWGILYAILKKRARDMCPISKQIIAISTGGTLYPCHMNNGESHNNLGSIYGDNIFTDHKLAQINNSFFSLKNNEKCEKCWANNLCGGCSMKWFYNNENKKFEKKPNEKLCVLTQDYLEKILLMISHIRKNTDIWTVFLEKAKKEYGT
jgi:uncharacterized protein